MGTASGAKRGRGRPRGAGVVDDDELLHRALVALAHGGYRALSMRALARSFDVSLASIQHRHATKDDLWRAAIDHMVAGSDEVAAQESFPRMLERRIREAAAYPGLMASLLADDAPGSEERLEYLATRLAPSFDAARTVLADAAEQGMIRDIDPEVLIATMLVGIGAIGALPDKLSSVLGLGDDPQARLSSGIADLLLHGVASRPA